MLAPPGLPPQYSQVVIIGGGLTGLSVAANFKMAGVDDTVILEKSAMVGGVWRTVGNSFSRVNISGPGYYLPTSKAHTRDSIFHPYQHDIFNDAADVLRTHELQSKFNVNVEVAAIAPYAESQRREELGVVGREGHPPKWTAAGMHAPSRTRKAAFRTHCKLVCVCTNRRLGAPRSIVFPGEEAFAGDIRRGLGDDATKIDWAGKRACIVGFGAYAAELMRTALEREVGGANHVLILARQLTTVQTRIADYSNYIRPWDEQLRNHQYKGSREFGKIVGQVYMTSGAPAPKQLKPDGGTLLLSDLFFIGYYLTMVETAVDEVERIEPDRILTQRGKQHPVQVLIKAVGFEPQLGAEILTGKASMCGVGLVADGLWIKGEPHIDNGFDTNTPLASSIFYSVPWFSQNIVRYWQLEGASAKLLSSAVNAPRVRTNWFTLSEWVVSYRHLGEFDPPVDSMFREYVESVRQRFLAVSAPEEYIAGNMWEWEAMQKQLAKRVPHVKKPLWKWPFEEVIMQIVIDELGARA